MNEIAELRRTEAMIDEGSRRLDRLTQRLSVLIPHHIVIFGYFLPGMWAELPAGWQTMTEMRVTPRSGLPPVDLTGMKAIGVAVDVAERMIKRATKS